MQCLNLTKNTNCDLKYSSIIDFIELLQQCSSEISNLLKTTITVDSNLNSQSDNPVKNSTITKELFNKVDKSALKNIAYTGKYQDLICAPTRLPNPESLIIKYPNKTVLYDGTEAVQINFEQAGLEDIYQKLDDIYQKIDTLKKRIDALEKDNPKPPEPEVEKHYQTDVNISSNLIEFPAGLTSSSASFPVPYTIQFNESGKILDSDYTDIQMKIKTSDTDLSIANENPYNGTLYFSIPGTKSITASGSAKYKNTTVSFPSVSKTITSVMASYIGYVNDVDASSISGAINGSNTLSNKTKLVKKNISGTYTEGFDFADLAYLYVAIPDNGNVDSISTVLQHTVIDVAIKMNVSKVVVNKQSYTVYTSKVAHKKGTYQFILK